MQGTQRISMAAVLASSAGSLLAATVSTVLLSAAVLAGPGTVPGDGYDGPSVSQGMDLPMTPTWVGGPQPYQAPEPAPEPIPETPDPGTDPRDTPAPRFFGEEIDTETDSILYVIDQSGSMSIRAEPYEDLNNNIVSDGSRLDRAKAELKRSISGLPENFYFNVLFYDECVSQCFGSKVQASAANKTMAFSWVDAIQPDGWTNTGLAVQKALTDKENKTVVLLSDGAPNFLDCAMQYVGGTDDHASLIRSENTQGAVINAFGIGIASDPTSRAFMQRVAAENGGSYSEVN
ncbi:MAG: VWA domain-containing protein [Planctomycetes bacterium]|nr:VWA domain-containing protein [Planctomycetota bacterium]